MRVSIEWEAVRPTGEATVRLWWRGHISGERSVVIVVPFGAGWMWQYKHNQYATFSSDQEAKDRAQQWFTDREPPLP